MSEIRLPNINSVQLTGRLIKDCELKTFSNGGSVLNGCIAVNDNYKNQTTGEWVDRTHFLNFTLNGKQAENLTDKLKKGNPVFLEGKIQTRKYIDKTDTERTFTEIIVYRIQNLIKNEPVLNDINSKQETKKDKWNIADEAEDQDIPF